MNRDLFQVSLNCDASLLKNFEAGQVIQLFLVDKYPLSEPCRGSVVLKIMSDQVLTRTNHLGSKSANQMPSKSTNQKRTLKRSKTDGIDSNRPLDLSPKVSFAFQFNYKVFSLEMKSAITKSMFSNRIILDRYLDLRKRKSSSVE